MQKMIHGNVNANGTTKSGHDFSVKHLGSGLYEIEFKVSFPEIPTVLVTQNYPGWDSFDSDRVNTTDNAVIVAVSKEKAKIKTGNSDGNGVDRNFSFLAICEIPT